MLIQNVCFSIANVNKQLKFLTMITLQYFNGKEWINVEKWNYEALAWVSLGGDDFNYRTIDENGNVLTDKSKFNKNKSGEKQ